MKAHSQKRQKSTAWFDFMRSAVDQPKTHREIRTFAQNVRFMGERVDYLVGHEARQDELAVNL